MERRLKKKSDVLSAFRVWWFAFAILLAICSGSLCFGYKAGAFIINPAYLTVVDIGCLGMLVVITVAIAEWKKGNRF